SLTFEVQDIPAIVAASHAAGAVVLMDNTWATPLYFKAIEHGVDVSIHAATKYIAGHSDAMLGVTVTTEEAYLPVKRTTSLNGHCAGPDDVYLGLRGLRTMAVRLKQHFETAMVLIDWFQRQAEVDRVLFPALEDDPGHALWRRDFLGATGLFGVVLAKPVSKKALAALHDGLNLFSMGESWGGYESLMLPRYPARNRTATKWETPGPLLRVHAGLEDPDDLIADLAAGFERLRKAD
ncbi:MAG: PLP-dependent transferase, partial [Alphaproteobacteria bacterium]|nr:PLP-dependent transferase [Alphaproteobacteria bacterium]